ncbi:hypothetical protein LJB91_01630 [Bacteroidales bacterium OttesenSCG-928-L03]|nr:hypothetical protein [Bacteroidales bacterium OttesenSCG-928-L03]
MDMNLINKIKTACLCLCLGSLASCSDFFEPDNSTYLDGKDYIKETSEMYSGFVGIATKLQAIGDKAIYLTDVRAEMFEPTGNSTELTELYNYETDLTGNKFADPAKYYDVIHACDDYMAKAQDYRAKHPYSVDETHYKGLIGGALRIKAWVYFTLGKIYGEAVWFDRPLNEVVVYPNPIDLDEIIVKCEELLEVGFDGVDGKSKMLWGEWISATDDAASEIIGQYANWDMMTPEYFVLAAELELWKRIPDYSRIVYDLLLPNMNEAFETSPINNTWSKWMLTIGYGNGFGSIFRTTSNVPVSMITYNHLRNQVNDLEVVFKRSSTRMLVPADVAVARFRDPNFNPAVDNQDFTLKYDRRESNYIRGEEGNYYFYKYNVGDTDDNPIFIYRSIELYLMLIESFNHLKEYDQMDVLLNKTVFGRFPGINDFITWPGFTDYWREYTPRGKRAYAASSGVRTIANANQPRTMMTFEDADDVAAAIRHNDMEILKEMILEYAGEGKTYPAMLRMARRYNDYNIIADLVCPKYPEDKQDEIRQRILDGGYFVPWKLDSKSSSH